MASPKNMICNSRDKRGMFTIPKHPGVGQELDDSLIRERRHLSYLQSITLVCGLIFLVPIIFLKFCFYGFRFHEVLALLFPSQAVSCGQNYLQIKINLLIFILLFVGPS